MAAASTNPTANSTGMAPAAKSSPGGAPACHPRPITEVVCSLGVRPSTKNSRRLRPTRPCSIPCSPIWRGRSSRGHSMAVTPRLLGASLVLGPKSPLRGSSALNPKGILMLGDNSQRPASPPNWRSTCPQRRVASLGYCLRYSADAGGEASAPANHPRCNLNDADRSSHGKPLRIVGPETAHHCVGR